MNYSFYDELMSEMLKQKLVKQRKDEILILKKRIKQLEQELDGMGVSTQSCLNESDYTRD